MMAEKKDDSKADWTADTWVASKAYWTVEWSVVRKVGCSAVSSVGC